MNATILKVLVLALVLGLAGLLEGPASAAMLHKRVVETTPQSQQSPRFHKGLQREGFQREGFQQAQAGISRRQAKDIAEGANPGFRAKAVDLLNSGQYAVTLSDGNSVITVMVDATSGSIN